MLALMFDPRFKNMKLIIVFLDYENGVVIVVEYDQQFVLPLLTKTTKLLMLASVEKVEDLQSQGNAEDFFQTISTNVDTNKDLVSREFIGFHQYLINVENCKCLVSWWCKKQNKFPTLAILARHIFGILASQIKTKHIFSITTILTMLWRCCFQTENVDKLIFVHKNQPSNM
jgi:hypothetical protein